MRRYLALGLVQLLSICLSGWLRRASWGEIDFVEEAWPLSAQLSVYCLAAWLITIAIAIGLAVFDKPNRSMIVLFLILLLPSMEFFMCLALTF